jgi:hypothetical protein
MNESAAAKLERLLAMTARLTTALTMDVAALEQGRPREFKLIEPEFQRLASVYEREAAGFTRREMESLPEERRAVYVASVKQLSDLLKQQQRLLTRVRRVSEGMIRAVADELARRESAARPYTPAPMGGRSPGAMLCNQIA